MRNLRRRARLGPTSIGSYSCYAADSLDEGDEDVDELLSLDVDELLSLDEDELLSLDEDDSFLRESVT